MNPIPIPIANKDIIVINDKYRVVIDAGDYLILNGLGIIGNPVADFKHPNLFFKQAKLLEFKHYRANGSKFWTAKAGYLFYFVVPKSRIELIPEEMGCSYPKILISGNPFTLNVSGGGASEWTDLIHSNSSVCGFKTIKGIRTLAECAWSMDECKANHVAPLQDDVSQGKEEDLFERTCQKNWFERAYQQTIELKVGMKVVLYDGREFTMTGKFKNSPVITNGLITYNRVPKNMINWTATAKANNIKEFEFKSWSGLDQVAPVEKECPC